MRICVHRDQFAASRFLTDEDIRGILGTVADGTDTQDLVVALYLEVMSSSWHGEFMAADTVDRCLARNGRNWRVASRYPRMATNGRALIRMAIGDKWLRARNINEKYGLRLRTGAFADLLAFLFAHELHHYRRYHLGLHPGEGEKAADLWALARTKAMGRTVDGQMSHGRRKARQQPQPSLPSGRRPKILSRVKQAAAHLGMEDLDDLSDWLSRRRQDAREASRRSKKAEHYRRMKMLVVDAHVWVRRDPQNRYDGQIAVKLRTLGNGSRRMAIRMPDGKAYRWPMDWLEIVQEDPGVTAQPSP